jgi:hypothetical protein
MKFLNLETGYSFDALWTNTNESIQENGYIFWFKNEQSIGIVYTMPIAFITESSDPVKLYIEDNDIFSFICSDDKSKTGVIYSNEYITVPENIGNNTFVHVFNIVCKSDNAGEYICCVNIGEKENNGITNFIKVGADFYGEHEPIYINLSNMGVELPNSIQKAIYDTNVHEDITDHILINRKFKELLSNYWDIIANKGSYKSLLNSLEWFEWNDQLNIKEIYRKNIADKIFYLDKDIVDDLNNNIKTYINNFIKTNYIALYCSLQNELPSYDNEFNPELEQVVFKWCKEDIQLKIALFAKFFGLYFLPIHLSILHATVEDKVFTNTIKNIHANGITREDNIGSFETVESNIKNNDCFVISNVRAQVTKDTVFGVQYPNKENNVFGVDVFPSDDISTEEELKTFSQQYYTGPGAIIPIKLTLTNIDSSEFVKETIIDYTDDSDKYQHLNFNNIFSPELIHKPNKEIEYKIDISFNFLAKSVKKYILNFTFILSSSKTLTKQIVFNVEDIDNVNINIYKVQAKDNKNGFSYEDFNTIGKSSNYLFKIQNNNYTTFYTQYLPYLGTYDNNYKGIKLNKTTILQVLEDISVNDLSTIISKINNLGKDKSFIDNQFLYFIKKNSDNKITYITFVSKYFSIDESEELINRAVKIKQNNNNLFKAIRSDYVFYPQFHDLVKIEGNTIEDYTVKPYEALCTAAEISLGSETILFKYGHLIDKAEWTFYNHLTNETIIHPVSAQTPFIADSNKLLENGYYDVVFKCSLNNGSVKEYKLNSAFRIKD